MFSEAFPLQILTLGEEFEFTIGRPHWAAGRQPFDADLPEIEQTDEFTGYWQNVGDGTIENPTGEFVFTSAQLMEQFDGSTMADTWVWQPVVEFGTLVSIPYLDAYRGTQVAIPVTIENNPGLATFEMVVWYDPAIMTPTGVQLGDAGQGFFIGHNLNFASDGVSITGVNMNNPNNNGNILYVLFDIDITAPLGTYPMEIELIRFNTLQGFVPTPIDHLATRSGSVTMIPVLAGDVDGDGFVTADDALMIFFYLAGMIDLDPRQRIAADVNQDGVIDLLDANLILMIAAGGEQAPGWFSAGISDFEKAEIEEQLTDMPEDSNVIAVPISIENNIGLSGFDFTLRYDNERLAPIGFKQGDAWQDLIIFNPEAGEDYVKLLGASAFNDSTDGAIAYVLFEIIGDDIVLATDYVELEVEGLA